MATDEKLISQLFDNQPDSVVWFSPILDPSGALSDFEVRYCNAAACRLLNATTDRIIGTTLRTTDLMDKISVQHILEQASKVWETGDPVEFTYYSPGFDKHLNVQRSKVMNGILSITRDRTAEVRAEIENQHRERLLTVMLNSSINGVYTLRAVRSPEGKVEDFVVTHVNDVLCAMAGKAKEQLIGRRFLELFPGTREAGVFDRNCQVLETGVPVREESHYTGQGFDNWYDTAVNKVSDEELVVAFNEITPLKKAAILLEKSNADLQKSNDNLSEFAYVVSHDLSEPLRKILTYDSIIRERFDGKFDPEVGGYLEKITKTANRMQRLIRSLLYYSQSTRVLSNLEQLSLKSIVEEVLGDLETAVQQRKAKVTVGDLPSIKGDRTQLTQVFQNLISNALKFQKKESLPEIEVAYEGIVKRPEGRYHSISVSDNGIGFEKSLSSRIFDVFQRLHPAEYDGSGVGLAIVRKAVQNHGGIVEVESELGTGSTFTLLFPA